MKTTDRIGFTENRLTRDGEARTDDTLTAALADPKALFYLKSADGWLCDVSSGAPEPGFERAAAETLGAIGSDTILLGHAPDGTPVLALAAGTGATLPEAISTIDLRSLASQGVLDGDIEGRLAQAQHVLLWHAANGFCARCGSPTASLAAGFKRKCTACGTEVFPRINPVTIMLIHDGAGRCILGRQPQFPEHMWSCLAGFVEAGETLEDAVRRETLEEAGVTVGAVSYLFSQPWPFPGNLMIGCTGLATSSDIRFDSIELEACRWFSRQEAAAMLAGTHEAGLKAPQPLAIAHHLLKAFVEGREAG